MSAVQVLILLLLGALFFLTGVAATVVSIKAAKFRLDLRPGEPFTEGKSMIWQWNVYRRTNYSQDGQGMWRWLVAVTAAQGLEMVLIMGVLWLWYFR